MQSTTRERNSSAIIPFDFEGTSVRVINRNGEPWFILVDLCRAFDLRNPSSVAGRLESDEKDTLRQTEGAENWGFSTGRGCLPTIVNESGMYRLVFLSNKPAAKRFVKVVTSEILPEIRRTGAYNANPIQPRMTMAEMTLQVIGDLQAQVAEQRAALEVIAPKARICDRIVKAESELLISDAAKVLKVQRNTLIQWMVLEGWIFRRSKHEPWLAQKVKVDDGLMANSVGSFRTADGREGVRPQTQVTSKGLARLAANIESLEALEAANLAAQRAAANERQRLRRLEQKRREEFQRHSARRHSVSSRNNGFDDYTEADIERMIEDSEMSWSPDRWHPYDDERWR